jgi:hypothetical protein
MTDRAVPHACALLAAVLSGAPVSVSAQASTSGAPTTGGAPLTLAASLFSAHESMAENTRRPEQGRLNLALGYSRRTPATGLDFSASSVVPYAAGPRVEDASYAGSGRYSAQLGRRTRLDIAESVSQQPLNVAAVSGALAAAPGAAIPLGASATGVLSLRETRVDGSFSLARTLGPRSSATFSFTHNDSRSPGQRPASSRLLSARFERRVSAATAVHAGYGVGTATFATETTVPGVRHDVDFGISYARPLPFSRRTMLDASTGSTLLTDGIRHQLRLVVNGGLFRSLGRWSARLGYSRPIQYVAGFHQPFLSDAVHVSVDGRPGDAWQLSMASGVARGSVGFGGGSRGYESYSLSVRAQRKIARAWHLEAEAFATSFQFTNGSVDGVLPSRVERRGVRGGLSWSTAFFRR